MRRKKPTRRKKSWIKRYIHSIIPPYSRADIFPLFITLFLLVSAYYGLSPVFAGKGAFSNQTAVLQADKATFTFTYSSSAPKYRLDMSASPDMKKKVFRNFGKGSSSPIVVTKPTRFKEYKCGSTLYWIVVASNERSITQSVSAVQTAYVDCIASPSATPTPSSKPTPTTKLSPTPSSACSSPQTKPANVTMQGTDGTWCYESDGNGDLYNSGYCMDNCSKKGDFCEGGTPPPFVRDGYCTGSCNGSQCTKVHCEFGGYNCPSYTGKYCASGTCSLSSPTLFSTPAPASAAAKRIFVVSTMYAGNFGGLSAADAICQSKANSANLGGSWKAWLSDNNTSASQRLQHFNGIYKRTDGLIIAYNWDDLTDGNLENRIIKDEKGIDRSNTLSAVWTGTTPSGDSASANCANWTSNAVSMYGQVGGINTTLSYWTQGAGGPNLCSSQSAGFYCVEQ